MRRVLAALVVAGLAIGVFLLWPRSEPNGPTDTVAGATTTTTSTSLSDTVTTAVDGSRSTTPGEDSHVVETVEEAEEILRELWFGWFEGIYNQDEDRIREVVGNPDQVENAVAQFGVMEFDAPPSREGIVLGDTEILRSDAECLSIWSDVTSEFRDGSITGVHVFRPQSNTWLLINTWPLRGDLWESDCDAQLQP